MKYLPLLLIILLVTSCTKVKKEYYPNGDLQSEIRYRGEVKDGEAIYYYNNGNINIRCNYSNDLLDGLYEKFDPDGNILESTHYKEGFKNGSSVQYFENGKIAVKMNFLDNLPQGQYTEYFDNGQVKISGAYENGYFQGSWEYYDFNGLQVGNADFEKGKGVQVGYYYGTSKKRVVIEFEKNVKNGKEEYYTKGGKLSKIIYYNNGEIDHVERISDENSEK